jgi:O-methyltransferase
MGLGMNFAPIIFELLAGIEHRRSIVTLGRVTLDFNAIKANEMLTAAGFDCKLEASTAFNDQALFAAIGFETIHSIDLSNFEGATHVLDLNSNSLPADMQSQYDVVLNAGTLEHVFHIDRGIATCINMLRVGGRLISVAPMNNYVDHGFYQISPTFFADYAQANHLTIEASYEVEVTDQSGKSAVIRSVRPDDFGVVGALNANPRLFVSMLKKKQDSTSGNTPIQAYYQRIFESQTTKAERPHTRRTTTIIDGVIKAQKSRAHELSPTLANEATVKHTPILARAIRPGPYGGKQWIIDLPNNIPAGDFGHPLTSGLRLFEDGQELEGRHCGHQEIADEGMGRYSHWGKSLYFSTSDNSDPRVNNRRYTIFWDETLHKSIVGMIKLSITPPSGRGEMYDVALSGPVAPPLDNLPGLMAQVRELAELHLTDAERFALAETLAHSAYPSFRFAEFGRRFLEDDHLFWEDYCRFMDPGNWHSHDRKYTLKELLKLTRHVRGHFAECGVYTGGSAHLMCREAKMQGRRVHLFDSFEGLSQPGPYDGTYWRTGSLAVSEESVRETLSDWDCFDIFKGWIPEAFPRVSDNQYAFVHLDLDLEAPTHESLDFFVPRMNRGGVILLDDYGFHSCPGVTHAADKFFCKRSEEIVMLPTGQGFVIVQ